MNDKNQLGLAKNLMWILMEDFTNLTNYPVPLEPTLCHCIIGQIFILLKKSFLEKLSNSTFFLISAPKINFSYFKIWFSRFVGDQDRYIARNGAPDFEKVWPGMSVEHLQGHGHVTAFMLARSLLNPRLVALFQKASSPDYCPKPSSSSSITTPIPHTPIKNIIIP